MGLYIERDNGKHDWLETVYVGYVPRVGDRLRSKKEAYEVLLVEWVVEDETHMNARLLLRPIQDNGLGRGKNVFWQNSFTKPEAGSSR